MLDQQACKTCTAVLWLMRSDPAEVSTYHHTSSPARLSINSYCRIRHAAEADQHVWSWRYQTNCATRCPRHAAPPAIVNASGCQHHKRPAACVQYNISPTVDILQFPATTSPRPSSLLPPRANSIGIELVLCCWTSTRAQLTRHRQASAWQLSRASISSVLAFVCRH